MRLFKDPILLALAGILATLLLLFFVGVIPYPFGLLEPVDSGIDEG